MLIMQNVVNAIEELKTQTKDQLRAIETGTIRSYNEKHESTKHISNTLGNRGTLISIDISPKALAISKSICARCKNITWVQSDSIKYLNQVQGDFDFVFLDSKNNAQTIWEEFCAIIPKIKPDGILIIDDAGIKSNGEKIDNSVPAKKAHLVWSKLKDIIPIKILKSAHGTQLRIDLSEKTLNKIKNMSEVKYPLIEASSHE